jgi:hypothetical protein
MIRNSYLIVILLLSFLDVFSQNNILEKEIKKSGLYFYETVLNPRDETSGKELAQKKLLKSSEIVAAISSGKKFYKEDVLFFIKKEEHLLKIIAYVSKNGSQKNINTSKNFITESDISENLKSVFLEKDYAKMIEKLEKLEKNTLVNIFYSNENIQDINNMYIVVLDENNKVIYILDKGDDSRKNLIDGKIITNSNYENEAKKIYIFEF